MSLFLSFRHLRDFRWRFGKSISSNSNSQPNIVKTTNYNKFQKLSAGRLKIRVLKDESLRAPVQSAPSPSVPNSGLGMTSRSREKGMISRQFEIKTAELL
ncbi:hypothetical protein ILYODFUR_026514 [Ilyodon furcidens]|uniref:Uncharacterized protein n=1 Tax=Ilyodon furcidens TaxID=33524 RepID=A0ABV0VHE1_9TELE